jgi:hypothetical protein
MRPEPESYTAPTRFVIAVYSVNLEHRRGHQAAEVVREGKALPIGLLSSCVKKSLGGGYYRLGLLCLPDEGGGPPDHGWIADLSGDVNMDSAAWNVSIGLRLG